MRAFFHNSELKKAASVSVLLLCGSFALFTVTKKFYVFTSSFQLSEQQTSLLNTLGDSALQHLDVPVASILLYNDSVIGTGYNTVLARGDAGGHAEINAISSALRNMGKEKFDALDRNNLKLITTFEPCLMCRGAIVEYRIHHVVFLKPKSLFHWLSQHSREIRYELVKKHGEPEALQDSLFYRHPLYTP